MFDPFCPMCGYQNDEGVSSCSKCGSALEEDAPSEHEDALKTGDRDNTTTADDSSAGPEPASTEPQNEEEKEAIPEYVSRDYSTDNGDEDEDRGTRLLNNRFKKIRVAYTARKSTIYRALDSTTGDIVAVKEMADRFSSDYDRQVAIKTFREEARRMMKFEHQGLPRIIDFFEEDGKYYIVKTFVEGENLKNRMKARGNKPYDQDLILTWTRQILETLSYLHTQSPPYIYKILKPSNVHVDKDDQTYLIDFDIDRIFSPKKDKEGKRDISHFRAPELKEGFSDGRSDLYSLGMLIRYLFTGINPDDEERYTRYKRVRDVNDKISPWFDELVLQMVSPSGQDRPASVGSVLETIKKHTEAEPLEIAKEEISPGPVVRKKGPGSGILTPRPAVAPPSEVKLSAPAKACESEPESRPVSRELLGLSLFALVPVLLVVIVLAALFLPGILAAGKIADGDRAMKIKDYSNALSSYEEADRMKSSAATLEKIGDANYRLDKYRDAITFYDKAIEKAPGRKNELHQRMAAAYMKIGQEAAERNDLVTAGNAFEQALLKNPELSELEDSKLLLLRGNALYNFKKYSLALKDYTKLAEMEPENADAFRGKGLTELKMGRMAEAVTDLKKAASLNKKYLPDYQNTVDYNIKESIKNALQLIKQNNLPEAMKVLAEAEKSAINSETSVKSSLADALTEAGMVRYRQGDQDGALELFNKALDYFPYCHKALQNRAEYYLLQKNYKKAGDDFKAIMALGGISNYERQRAQNQMEFCKRMAEYEERRATVITPVRTPYPTATKLPRPSGTKRYYLMGKSFNKAVIGTEGSSVPLLISGDVYSLRKNTWYDGHLKGDNLTLWIKSYSREHQQVYSSSHLETLTVAHITQKRIKTGRYSYNSTSTITFKRSNGSIVTIEDSYLARKLSQGQTLYGKVGIDQVEIYGPGNSYRGDSYKITGSGGIY